MAHKSVTPIRLVINADEKIREVLAMFPEVSYSWGEKISPRWREQVLFVQTEWGSPFVKYLEENGNQLGIRSVYELEYINELPQRETFHKRRLLDCATFSIASLDDIQRNLRAVRDIESLRLYVEPIEGGYAVFAVNTKRGHLGLGYPEGMSCWSEAVTMAYQASRGSDLQFSKVCVATVVGSCSTRYE